MNHFGDLTEEERESLLLSKNQPDVVYDQTYLELPPGFKAPTEIDWRKLGGVTTVKNQGDCLSCWAIAAAGALEAQYFRRHKELVELSVQNLVDCSTDYGNSCTGGRAGAAFKYIELNGGIDTEASYPYEGYENKCRYEPKYSKASCKGFMTIPANETILQSSVYMYGPISVSLDAAGYRFHFYKQGIYYNPSCKKEYHELNHAGLIVGYGAYTNMGDYWIMKNSWGADWGDHGYIKIARNRGNNCGITTDAVLPFLKDVPIPPEKK
ncbi:hypothetical protein O0L34_g5302 [Tuta absoluta]|nr:hypothetical protein O0L34_g5302 [Tuta absoluta]